VLTTFADVTVEDMSDSQASAQTDDLARVERQLYNEAGVSQMQFNTSGNLALEKSVLNDEATMYNMLLQFERFLNDLVSKFGKNSNKITYKVQILTTTIYNYKDLSKLYKEQTQLGYSKMLPQIALGQSQTSILANAYFENEILDLVHIFIPPLMSSTMNEEILNRGAGGGSENSRSGTGGKTDIAAEEKTAGRKEKPDDQKSEKTIQNRESMS
jgi:ankyrin repeat protein